MLLAAIGGDDDLVRAAAEPDRRVRRHRGEAAARAPCSSRPASATSRPRFSSETPPLLRRPTRLQPFIRDFANPYAAEGAPHVQSITDPGPVQRARRQRTRPSPRVVRVPPGRRPRDETRLRAADPLDARPARVSPAR